MLITVLTILLVLFLLFLIFLLLICPSDPTAAYYDAFANRAYAHRGLHGGEIPENSLPAFRKAAEKGYGIELDVGMTKDGKIVVFHDDDLARLCGDKRKISETGYAQLRKLTLAGSGEHIPLLSEVLSEIAGRVPVIVEFKTCRDYKPFCDAAAEILDKYKGAFCVQSFDPRILRTLRKIRPAWMRGQLVCRQSAKGKFQNFVFTNLLLNLVSRPHFISCRASETGSLSFRLATGLLRGLSAVWTVRSLDELNAQCEKDADMVIFEGFSAPTVLYNETVEQEEVKWKISRKK